jgi:putative FmdB family regulatory protein
LALRVLSNFGERGQFMPSYDYRCAECKTDFTVERSMMDNSSQPCTSCGADNASRIWNVFIQISGSTPDYGQSSSSSSSSTTSTKKSGCGSCSSHSCGTC